MMYNDRKNQIMIIWLINNGYLDLIETNFQM